MTNQQPNARALAIVELLEIPDSYYPLASQRYESLGRWLHRPESSVSKLAPAVYPQGSFRYGTVVRPLLKHEEYDLDLVAEIQKLTKGHGSQRDLKQMIGEEVHLYAESHGIKEPPEEKPRCWRLDYADQVKFHMDILPAIPDDNEFRNWLSAHGVAPELAKFAIGITDKRHPSYAAITTDWPRSNPRGFAGWFEGRMRAQAQSRMQSLAERRVYASIDDVPAWDWKTPLQRSIQILKRHRDVMFRKNPDVAPISMIITSLAAHSYEGEVNVFEALNNIVQKMDRFVRPNAPRVPNPVNPAEDFADRWSADARLEPAFRLWHAQVKADVAALGRELDFEQLDKHAEGRFGVSLPIATTKSLAGTAAGASIVRVAAPSVIINSPPKPWRVR